MTGQPDRRDEGGRIDRSRSLSFTFDGTAYRGFGGDTLASALLANRVRLVGRSFKYHRPRGIYAAGVEEPNALVSLRRGDRREPNVPATTVELFDGLAAGSQNRWPSLSFDIMSVVDRLSPVFAAGFYYKTFMGPTRGAWMFYEKLIRRAAGLGQPPTAPDPDRYEKAHAFCDVLVIGAGPAGLAAALAAGRSGARVVLVEDDPELGGSLLAEPAGGATDAWLARTRAGLCDLANVRIMTRTTVFGAYDNLIFGLLERVSDHLAAPAPHQPRQRFWTLRARRAVLAAGAIERPLVFGNNDLPGVMLASAARGYLNRHAVLPGRRVVAFTNNDSVYEPAFDLARAGAAVVVVDVRPETPAALRRRADDTGVTLRPGQAVAAVHGRRTVEGVDVVPFDPARPAPAAVAARLPCDLVAVSGGWTPTLHLLGQRGAKPVLDPGLGSLRPGPAPPGFAAAGAAAGDEGTAVCVEGGWRAGIAAAEDCGFAAPGHGDAPALEPSDDAGARPAAPVWLIPHPPGRRRPKRFVDLQNDVADDDIALAHREGYASVEHLKRYTTLGMATDQGKTSSVNAIAILADLAGQPFPAMGTTTYRPPYRPVAIGALAGPETGTHFRPIRRSPMHEWHVRHGAVFTDAGLWRRPWYYPRPGESRESAYVREAARVRETVGIVDVSSLGKIDVQGPDAAAFLDRVYVNNWSGLPVGKARYGVMLRPDGVVFDDGTTSRIAEHHYFMTTTTGNAGPVMSHLEYLLQAVWPELRVHVTSVTGQWAGIAVAGPRSRALLRRVVSDIDFDPERFPFMGVGHGHARGIPVRVLRISFSGELAYEAYTPAGHGEALWRLLWDEGRDLGLEAYGTEALGTLRIEKGHVAGPELDGRTTLADLGLERMASRKKAFVGGSLSRREGLEAEDRQRLVGLEAAGNGARFRAGAILCHRGRHEGHGIGVVTSVTHSPALGRTIGIGLLTGGMARDGEIVDAVFPLRDEVTAVRVRSPHFVDPEGERLRD